MTQTDDNSNFTLRKKLKALITQAQTNENKLQKLQQQELLLISAESLPQLIDVILQQYRQEYELEHVSLLLIDHDYEIRHIIDFMSPGLLMLKTLIFNNNHTLLENILHTKKNKRTSALGVQKTLFPNIQDEPYLGECNVACKNLLFSSMTELPQSVAVVPLIRNHKLIGSLNLASNDAARFMAGSGTDIIKRLSIILAVCIENAINNEKLKLLGLTDALTGIHNRRYFMQRLEEEIVHGLRQNLPVSCLFIDIDHFKSFNDIYGHSVGDKVLRDVATIIKKQMRLSDVLARYGGEEFSVLLTNTDTLLAQDIAERIRSSISDAVLKVKTLPDDLHVTVSIGCTTMFNTHISNVTFLGETLLNAADKALYASKDAGRNCINVSDFNEIATAQATN
jgi:diguanylate cyclase (GGDEF)-like protein